MKDCCSKAEIAAEAYMAIPEYLPDGMTYRERLDVIGDVIKIMTCMSQEEKRQALQNTPKERSGCQS